MAALKRVAVVTGASSGFGEETARQLAAAGFMVVVGARRMDRLAALAQQINGLALHLDVRDLRGISDFVSTVDREFGQIDILVNNAGLAAGLEPVAEGRDEDWVEMMESNVLGVLRMTRSCLPLIRRARRGHIVNMGSVAGFEVYAGGAGYTASKHAVRAISRTLRLELLGEPIRVTEIAPGLAETEFSLVRFKGDKDRAAAPYRGVEPLVAADVAECVLWAVTRPEHVNIDEIVVRPLAQATTRDYARRS
ncbi:MAG TPA: SDR family NAD(P)-dependent oxidoreductase [Candidatus Dormibacteraeota bacterium]